MEIITQISRNKISITILTRLIQIFPIYFSTNIFTVQDSAQVFALFGLAMVYAIR